MRGGGRRKEWRAEEEGLITGPQMVATRDDLAGDSFSVPASCGSDEGGTCARRGFRFRGRRPGLREESSTSGSGACDCHRLAARTCDFSLLTSDPCLATRRSPGAPTDSRPPATTRAGKLLSFPLLLPPSFSRPPSPRCLLGARHRLYVSVPAHLPRNGLLMLSADVPPLSPSSSSPGSAAALHCSPPSMCPRRQSHLETHCTYALHGRSVGPSNHHHRSSIGAYHRLIVQ